MDLTKSAAEGWRMRSRKSCQVSGAVEDPNTSVLPPPPASIGPRFLPEIGTAFEGGRREQRKMKFLVQNQCSLARLIDRSWITMQQEKQVGLLLSFEDWSSYDVCFEIRKHTQIIIHSLEFSQIPRTPFIYFTFYFYFIFFP